MTLNYYDPLKKMTSTYYDVINMGNTTRVVLHEEGSKCVCIYYLLDSIHLSK